MKYWLVHEHRFQFTSAHEASVKLLRSLYDQEAYMRLKPMRGQRAEKSDVLWPIDRYDTDKKNDIRKRAICLVNLITSNRTVQVMMVKQGEMKEKLLTLKCVQATQNYVAACGLVT